MTLEQSMMAHSYPRTPQVISYMIMHDPYKPSIPYTKNVVTAKFYGAPDDALSIMDYDCTSNTFHHITFTHDENDRLIYWSDERWDYLLLYVVCDFIDSINDDRLAYITSDINYISYLVDSELKNPNTEKVMRHLS